MKAFFTILQSLVLDYFYSNISISVVTMNFNQVCNFIRNYFEEAKYKQNIFSKWNKLTLKSIISKSKGKPIEKCLVKLIDKLWHLQHYLDHKLYKNRFILNKIINAYQNIFTYQYTCFKHAKSLTRLINNLNFLIITYTQANRINKAFFIDQ